MPQAIQLSSDAERVIRWFGTLPAEVRSEVCNGIRRGLLILQGRVLQGTGLKWRRGAGGLAGRLTSFARLGGPSGIDAAIGFRKTRGFPYEMAQEFGATARGGGAMAIPVSPEAKAESERGNGPRSFGLPLRLIKSGTSALLMHSVKQFNTVHYILVKSIPPRLKFRETVAANMDVIERGIAAGARDGMAKARARA